MNRLSVQQLGNLLLFTITIVVVIPILFVILAIIIRGLPAVNWTFLTEMPHDGMKAGGILPAIVGTLLLTFGSAITAIPIGVGGAIYLSEYARDNLLTRSIRLAIINLAGIPSVVYGLFGLGLFVLFLQLGNSIIAASLTLGIMTIPSLSVLPRRHEECTYRISHCERKLGRNALAGNPLYHFTPSFARYYHRGNSRLTARSWRNSTYSLYWSCFFPSQITFLPI
jgi:hypothetical protein